MSTFRPRPNFLDAKVDANGVVRWKSNGEVPPQDVLEIWADAGFSFDFDESNKVREKEFAQFVKRYRKVNKGPSAEDKSEMRASFGPGTKVVNIITGRTTQL